MKPLNSARSLVVSLIASLLVPAAAFAEGAPYCLALRGNGELQPAHWGALANLVEKAGLPAAQAGGSSASISAFLLENIAKNPRVDGASFEEQKLRASFLLKSLYGIAVSYGQTPQGSSALGLWSDFQKIQKLKETASLSILKEIIASNNLNALRDKKEKLTILVQDLRSFGIGDMPKYAPLVKALDDLTHISTFSFRSMKQVRFYAQDLLKAITAIGAFDAESDPSLFFREGIINFEKLAFGYGKVATFLSGRHWDLKTSSKFMELVDLCEAGHVGLTWQELVQKEPRCQQILNETVQAYFAQNIDWEKENAVLDPIGSKIPSFPTTAVLVGTAYAQAQQAYRAYHENLNRNAAVSFKIANTNDVRLGYWGRSEQLALIEKNLRQPFTDGKGRAFDFTQDHKSLRFLALGQAPWIEALRVSPAEPGLSALAPMTVNGQPALSAGGWSDLHPVLVLKAAGCDQVVYVTRKGGESLFGQGVAKRLLNLERGWEFLRTSDKNVTERNGRINNQGDPSDMASRWSMLYNTANPRSSFMVSVASADAVLCTDWNSFDVKNQLSDLVTQSYRSPFVIGKQADPLASMLVTSGAQGITNPQSAAPNGTKDWAGCIAPAQ